MNDFLYDLCAWLKSGVWGRKVLFARDRVAGNRILRMAAAHGTPAVNAVPTTVREYMVSLAAPALAKAGLQRIDPLTASIALQEIMKDFGDAFTTMGVVELSTAGSVLPQLDELERNGITPDRLAGTGEDLLSSVWRRYLEWKQENSYASEKQILDAALVPEGVSFGILSNTEIDETEAAFLSGIPADRLKVICIKIPDGNELPRNAYARALPSISPVKAGDRPDAECFSCQDMGTEIRFAYQYIVEHDIPAERAVIVCPDDAYGTRAAEEGRLLGIGADSLFGIPAAKTKTALMIRCLLDWADRNYDVEALTPALVSGSMAIYNERDEIQTAGQTILRVLRSQRVGWGKERWAQFEASENRTRAGIGRVMNGWVRFFEAPARPVREVALELTGLLETCMIRGVENSFYLMFVDELSRIYTGKMKGRDYLAQVEEVAAAQKISTQTAERPGNVYVCGYEDALYIDRGHFIMLGMNWDAFNRLGSEFPLLHDDKKAALSPRLRLIEDRARNKRYAVGEFLLNRPDAHAVFCMARMDHVGGEDLIPSSIFEDAARKYVTEDPETHGKTDKTPEVNILDRSPLTMLDVYLKTGYDPGLLRGAVDPGYEKMWEQAFKSRCFTPTRLETAAGCPRKYTLSVQMGIDRENPEALEQFGQTWLSAADRGNLIHHVLDRYFAAISPRRDEPDCELLDKLLDVQIDEYKKTVPVPSNLKDLSPETDAIRNAVIEAAQMHADDKERRTIGTEVSFGSDRPVELSFGAYTIRLAGRIDRVDMTGNEYEIIDYKTGRPSAFRRDIGNKLQYYLYSLAWEKLYPDRKVSRASYYMLDGAGGIERITIGMGDETRAEMERKITDLLGVISDPHKAFTPGFELDEAGREKGYDGCPAYCPFITLCREVFG